MLQSRQLILRLHRSQLQIFRVTSQRHYASNQNPTPNNSKSNSSKTDSKMSVPGQESAAPGLVGAHVQYVKGVAEGMVGSVTGSKAWADSGEQDKSQGIQDMKDASAHRDPSKQGMGRAEEIAGKMTGCVGMEQEGRESKDK